jgi:hypothetical protein
MSSAIARAIVIIGLLVATSANIGLPVSSVSAYSGLQTIRDETDTCCAQNPGWTRESNPSGYGYDTNIIWANGNVGNPGTWNAEWWPYPSPSPTVFCVYAHIASSGHSVSSVYYWHMSGTGVLIWSKAYTQSYNLNSWVPMDQSAYYSNASYVQEEDNSSNGSSFTGDAITFHYNSDYSTCS